MPANSEVRDPRTGTPNLRKDSINQPQMRQAQEPTTQHTTIYRTLASMSSPSSRVLAKGSSTSSSEIRLCTNQLSRPKVRSY